MRRTLFTIAALICAGGAAYAAPAMPNIGDAIRQVEPPKEVAPKIETIPQIKQQERPAMKKMDTATVFVKEFKISGNKAVATDVLMGIINKPENIGKNMTLTDIEAVASQVTKYYRNSGYFVARAYIPMQTMADGVVEIAVLEGYYGQFKLKNKSLVNDGTVQGMLDAVKDKNIISTGTIERAMLIINDTPGVRVTQADVLPGASVGTSDFNIGTQPTSRVSGYVVADNNGGRYTGMNRLMAGAGINSPFGFGDKLFLSGMISDTADLKNGRLSYSAPLTSTGMRGEVAYSKTTYSLGEEYESLDAEGSSDGLELNFTYPLIRTRLENLTGSLNLSAKSMKDEVHATDTVTEKDTKSAAAGLVWSKRYPMGGFAAESTLSGTFTLGTLSFDNDTDKAIDEAGADTNGTYSKVVFEGGQSVALTKKLTVKGNLKVQSSFGGKNLDGSEDLSIGGAYGVKVYPAGEMSAENGYILNAEVLYALPALGEFTSSVSVFADTAKASYADDFADEGSRTLSDAGIGFYGNYKNAFVKAYYARVIGGGKVESEPEYTSRFLVQAGMSF
jgi:hemolysin activation/secretion protein